MSLTPDVVEKIEGQQVLVVGLGLWLLPQHGPPGMALAWLLAHVLVLAGLVAAHLLRAGWDGAMAFTLDMASALAANLGKVRSPRGKSEAPPLPHRQLTQLLEAIGEPGAITWRPLASRVSYSDSAIQFLGDPASPTPAPRAVLKYSRSQEGMAALRRCLAGTAAAGARRHGTVAQALASARGQAAPGDRVLVFGSFHTAAAALESFARD